MATSARKTMQVAVILGDFNTPSTRKETAVITVGSDFWDISHEERAARIESHIGSHRWRSVHAV